MIVNPRVGQRVQLWYAKRFAHRWPLHGAVGVVRIVGKGKPRNHVVDVGGSLVVVPCGNLRPVP